MLSHKFHLHPIEQIWVDREARQRTDVETEDLEASIRRRGIYNPIIIREDGKLIAGERRLTAAQRIGLTEVPVRFAGELSDNEAQMIELEENVRRKDLPWQDQVNALTRLHKLFLLENPGATQADFAEYTGFTPAWISMVFKAATAIATGSARAAEAPTLAKAINVARRENERQQSNMLADIIDTLGSRAEAPPVETPPETVLCTDFRDWAASYDGPRFNLIHCDFPYGVELDQSGQVQVGGNAHKVYDDSEDTYWMLLCALANYRHTLISASAHMVFWHHPKFSEATRRFFASEMPEWTFDEVPLVWLKSDNRGIAPDVERRPRRITEFALFGWTGDRKLEKLFSNAYAAPKADGAHVSEKPEPVLRYFFSGLVSPHTRLLDPTCGSGSALRAADSLGAGSILGVELDPEYAELARSKLKSARALRSFTDA